MFPQKAPTPEPFQIVPPQQVKRLIQNNSLYFFIKELHDKRDAWIAKYDIQPTANRGAYMIHLQQPLACPPLLNFTYESAHLTIDQLFSDEHSARGRRGFTASHFTGIYKNGEDTLIVHAYFNCEGHYVPQSCQVKINGTRVQNEVESELEPQIVMNCKFSRTIIEALLGEKSTRHFLDCSATRAENENLYQSQSKADFEAKKIQLDQMMRHTGRFYDLPVEECEIITTESPPPTDALASLPITELTIIEKSEPDLFTQLQGHKKEFDALCEMPQNSKMLVKKYLKAKEIREILILCRFDEKFQKKSKTVKKQIPKIQGEIAAALDINMWFVQCCFSGDIESINQITEDINHLIHSDFYIVLLLKAIASLDNYQMAPLIQVLDHLFEVSPLYRSAIKLMSNRGFVQGDGFYINLALYAALFKKPLFVELFFKHGLDPNGSGILFNENTIPLFPAFMGLCVNNLPQYAHLFCSYGADLENNGHWIQKCAVIEITKLPGKDKPLTSVVGLKKQIPGVLKSSFETIFRSESCLELAAEFGDIEATSYLAAKTSLKYILLCLGNISHDGKIATSLRPSSTFHGMCAVLETNFNALEYQYYDPMGKKLLLILRPSPHQNADAQIKITQLLLSIISQKTADHTFSQIGDDFCKKGEAIVKRQGAVDAQEYRRAAILFHAYKMTLFLSENNDKNREKLMQNFCYLATIRKKLGKYPLAGHAYCAACITANGADNPSALQGTPIYQFALKQLTQNYPALLQDLLMAYPDLLHSTTTPQSPAQKLLPTTK